MNEPKTENNSGFDINKIIIEAKVPVLNEKGEFEYVQTETITYGHERFDELIEPRSVSVCKTESINNPDSW